MADGNISELKTDNLFFFNRSEMMQRADQLKDSFKAAKPFPHVVIDDFFPDDIARRIGESFPGINDIDWNFTGPGDTKHTGDKNIEKVASSDEEQFPDFIRFMMFQFQSGIFCKFLDHLTGFEHLAPDPSHNGCGLHSTGNGGRLMLHIDASRHPNKDLVQLINMIYYCTPDWDPDYGGGLELWNEDATECVEVVKPVFNRMVIFYTAGKSWHGHPHPVQCPPHMRRNSLALYYYTTDKGISDLDYTDYVLWKGVTEHDQMSLAQKAKYQLRRHLPAPIARTMTNVARSFRR